MRNFEEIPLDLVAWSEAQFRLTFRRVPERLQFSVRELGILNPLIVHETLVPGRYTLVTGWLRFQAAREAGDTSIPCHIFRSIPPKIMLLCSLFDNLGHRTMNPVEQAITLRRLEEFYTPEQIEANFLPLMRLGRGSEAGARAFGVVRRLADLPESLQWAVADQVLTPESALRLTPFPAGHLERLILLFRGLHADAVSQEIIVSEFLELWQNQGITPTEVILDEGWEWASPLEEAEEEWPTAPEAAGGTLPIPVVDPDAEAEREAIGGWLAEMVRMPAEERRMEADQGGRNGNRLIPGASARSSDEVLKLFNSPLPGNRDSGRNGGGERPDSGHMENLAAAGRLGRGHVCSRTMRVRQGLQERLGVSRMGAGQHGASRNGSETRSLPEEIRVIRSRGARGSTAGRLEVRFENSAQLRHLLECVLDAEERGEVTRILSARGA